MVLPFNGNMPVGVTAVLFASTAVTSDAAFKAKPVVLPALKPLPASIASMRSTVWPAGIERDKPEKVITPWFKETYWATTWPFWVR